MIVMQSLAYKRNKIRSCLFQEYIWDNSMAKWHGIYQCTFRITIHRMTFMFVNV